MFVMASCIAPVDDVECSLCKQPYRDPRLLPCLHAFCYECLKKLLDDSTEQQNTLLCPTCFEQAPLPTQHLPRHVYLSNNASTARRVAQFKTAKACENCESEEKACAFCCDCGESGLPICKQCVEFHKKVRSYKKHTVVSLDSDVKELVRKANEKESMICAKHTSEVLRYRYFCLDCEALACIECLHLDHANHKYKALESLFDEAKSEIQLASSVLEQTLPRLAQAGNAITDSVIDVDACNVKVKKEIEKAFAEIIAAAEKRKQELLVEAETMAVARKTRLQMQQECLEKLNVTTKFTLDTIKHSTQFYSPVELHSVKAVLKQSCTNLERRSAKALLGRATSPPVVASVHTADITTAISSLGSVEERLPCSPSHSGLVGINTKFPIGITKDGKRTLILQTRNSRGEPMVTGQDSVRAWLTDQSGRRVCDAEVSNSGDGRYGVTFCLQEAFSGKAHFTANGEHIDGSPCDVIVRDYTQLQKPQLSITTPSMPNYIYVSRSHGDIFVTLDNGDVCVYSSEGVLRSTISGASLGIECAHGMVVDEEREVMYVACYLSHKVVKATLDGKLLSAVGSKGSGHLQFDRPSGLCQDTAGNIYVAEYNNKRVQILVPDCSYRKELKCNNRTWGVAVDSHGNVHTAATYGVAIVDSELGYWNQVQCGDVAINQQNYRFVTYHSSDGTLEVRKPDNSLLHTICGLRVPFGVCLDQSGAIFVGEQRSSKVLKYC